jgi:hypothetical protein
VTADGFRALALRLPETTEQAHMGHPDFRVRSRIFATLGPNDAWGMVKLAADDQASFVQAQPTVFEPFRGAWGRQGATRVHLAAADAATVRRALAAAWRNVAPKGLVRGHGAKEDEPSP